MLARRRHGLPAPLRRAKLSLKMTGLPGDRQSRRAGMVAAFLSQLLWGGSRLSGRPPAAAGLQPSSWPPATTRRTCSRSAPIWPAKTRYVVLERLPGAMQERCLRLLNDVAGTLFRFRAEPKDVSIGIFNLHLVGPRPVQRRLPELRAVSLVPLEERLDIIYSDPDQLPGWPCPPWHNMIEWPSRETEAISEPASLPQSTPKPSTST